MGPRKRSMTRADAEAWRRRWKIVAARERRELAATSDADRLRQLASLMASVSALGARAALEEGDDDVRDRWNRLRRKLVA